MPLVIAPPPRVVKSCIRTYSAEALSIETIAHRLSRRSHFPAEAQNGYSAAQHCWLVSALVPSSHALSALLHEAHLTLLDWPGVALDLGESHPEAASAREAVASRFRIQADVAGLVERAHAAIEATERRDFPASAWCQEPSCAAQAKPLSDRIVRWSPEEAEEQFLGRFFQLESRGVLTGN